MAANQDMAPPAAARGRTIAAIEIFLFLWGGATAYLALNGEDWIFPVIALSVFAIAFSGLVIALSLGAQPAIAPVARPGVELGAMIVFLLVYAIGFLGFGMGALRRAFAPGQAQELAVLAVKLVVHVGIPALILIALGARIRSLFTGGPRPMVFWRVLVVLAIALTICLIVMSPSLDQIAALNAPWTTMAWAAPLSFAWITLVAGLCEEFLFRAVLQTRFEAALKSPVAAILATSVLFALAHVPGLYLRGGPGVDGWSEDVFQVIAYSVSTLAPLSILFGVIWMRTRSLLLCALLHGVVDVLPNMPGFFQTWVPGYGG